jgi:hypothetical protein
LLVNPYYDGFIIKNATVSVSPLWFDVIVNVFVPFDDTTTGPALG